jgi:hypothetical protein
MLGEAIQIINRRVLALKNEKKNTAPCRSYIRVQAPKAVMNKNTGIRVPLQTELWFRLHGYGRPPRRGSPWSDKLWANHQRNAGRPQAYRQILAAVLAANARKRAECCILAGQQQFAFPGMAGGCLRRRARGRLPPPEAGRRGGPPTRAEGGASARLAPRPGEDDEHPQH